MRKPLKRKVVEALIKKQYSINEIATRRNVPVTTVNRRVRKLTHDHGVDNFVTLAVKLYHDELLTDKAKGALPPRTWKPLEKIFAAHLSRIGKTKKRFLPRLLAIAELVEQGKNRRQIARVLKIHPITVKRDLFEMFEAIGGSRMVDLALLFHRDHYYDDLEKSRASRGA
jgi:DNA-binding NarL/FixJ family response regulator